MRKVNISKNKLEKLKIKKKKLKYIKEENKYKDKKNINNHYGDYGEKLLFDKRTKLILHL